MNAVIKPDDDLIVPTEGTGMDAAIEATGLVKTCKAAPAR